MLIVAVLAWPRMIALSNTTRIYMISKRESRGVVCSGRVWHTKKDSRKPGCNRQGKKKDYELTWKCIRLKEKRVCKNTNNGYYRVINVGLMLIGYKPRERQVCYRIGISTSDTILSYRAGPWMYIYFLNK